MSMIFLSETAAISFRMPNCVSFKKLFILEKFSKMFYNIASAFNSLSPLDESGLSKTDIYSCFT
jgi:hypothetical protein